jgi:catechol 2,3-dioxygenase-like lactoylglutathione lyase family enzyme
LPDALTHGVHHVGLAVRDLDEATSFFCGTLGFKEVGRNDAYPAVFVSDGGATLTIWRVTDPSNAVAFNRKTNIGLHHLALAVADQAALATVYERVRSHPASWSSLRRSLSARARPHITSSAPYPAASGSSSRRARVDARQRAGSAPP